MICEKSALILQNNGKNMEQNSTKFFKNRGLKRTYTAVPLVLAGLYLLLYFAAGRSWISPIGILVPSVAFLLFMPIKYAVSDENNIEFYSLFGRKKRITIPIESISEILIKRHRLLVDYKTREDMYLRSRVLELSETDMRTMVDELIKRNPAIVIH